MSFQENLMGDLKMVHDHLKKDITFGKDVIDFVTTLRSNRKDTISSLTKAVNDFQKKMDSESCYGGTKEALGQLIESVKKECEGQQKIVDELSAFIDEFKGKMKEIDKGLSTVKSDEEKRMKEIEKNKKAALSERDKYMKYHKEVESAENAVTKAKTDGLSPEKIKSLEEKVVHYQTKKDEQSKVYATAIDTANKRIKTFFYEDQIEFLGIYGEQEKVYVNSMNALLKGYMSTIKEYPQTMDETIKSLDEKVGNVNVEGDIAQFCDDHDTACRTPTYLPIYDTKGLIVKQEGALGLRRSDDPKGMERVCCTVKVIHDFNAEGKEELSVKRGDIVLVSEKHRGGWWYATYKDSGKGGFIPETYVKDVE